MRIRVHNVHTRITNSGEATIILESQRGHDKEEWSHHRSRGSTREWRVAVHREAQQQPRNALLHLGRVERRCVCDVDIGVSQGAFIRIYRFSAVRRLYVLFCSACSSLESQGTLAIELAVTPLGNHGVVRERA